MKRQFFALGFCLFCLTSFLVKPADASPVINEFSSGTSSDWVEIYNPDPESIDLSLYRVRDLTASNKIDLSGSLNSQSFATFEWSNKLNNGGDLIKLMLISNESIIDQTTYGNQGGLDAPDSTQTGGRKEDGGSEWVIFSVSSKGSSNNSSSVFIPPTPTPTSTPTPTKTPKKAKIITKAPTKALSTVKVSTGGYTISKAPVKSLSSNSNNSVKIASSFASIKNISGTPAKTSNKTEVLGAKDQKIPILMVLGGFLFILAGVSVFVLKYISLEEIYEKVFN